MFVELGDYPLPFALEREAVSPALHAGDTIITRTGTTLPACARFPVN